ncbi:hypothetical protein H634G_01785 [Metarhizium anisopliae BRIP 53293]|uniref:Uncharacterized protein n=1 Tax=Metarhizium anisopliae BRIP 53293 TaxID=1291518 RepID=A0A0D9P925_METAN|nr:hypothetical protein H634G_01785 [Metarhizium anisopliae BRIP 53293]KJK93392.1 hypothetical protein H633G_02770 [Metarhizium anisopliae BRIP 53284]
MHQDLIPATNTDAQAREHELAMLRMQLTALRWSIYHLDSLQTTIYGCLVDLSNLISTLEATHDLLEHLHNVMDAEDVGGFHQTSDEE